MSHRLYSNAAVACGAEAEDDPDVYLLYVLHLLLLSAAGDRSESFSIGALLLLLCLGE